jgi:hypothetical protein
MPQNDRFKAGQLHVRVPGADPKQKYMSTDFLPESRRSA